MKSYKSTNKKKIQKCFIVVIELRVIFLVLLNKPKHHELELGLNVASLRVPVERMVFFLTRKKNPRDNF